MGACAKSVVGVIEDTGGKQTGDGRGQAHHQLDDLHQQENKKEDGQQNQQAPKCSEFENDKRFFMIVPLFLRCIGFIFRADGGPCRDLYALFAPLFGFAPFLFISPFKTALGKIVDVIGLASFFAGASIQVRILLSFLFLLHFFRHGDFPLIDRVQGLAAFSSPV